MIDDYVKQFQEKDREAARCLVSSIVNISTDDCTNSIGKIIKAIASGKEKSAIYVEREFEGGRSKQPIFTPEKKRAIHPKNVPLVKPIRGRVGVGSEGVIARLASKIRSGNKGIVLSPGPQSIRINKVRNIIIVTDVIGSGSRIFGMLNSFYKVGSVKSWFSLKYIRFHVVCYAAADHGQKFIESHYFKPKIHSVKYLPTIYTEFSVPKSGFTKDDMVILCRQYDPFPAIVSPIGALGYGGVGALFSIGGICPNNAPRMLWEKAGRWKPLYSKFSSGYIVESVESEFDRIVRILENFSRNKIGSDQIRQVWVESRPIILCIFLFLKGVRSRVDLAEISGLAYSELDNILKIAENYGWVEGGKLTEQGREFVSILGSIKNLKNNLLPQEELIYLPQQLRSPI